MFSVAGSIDKVSVTVGFTAVPDGVLLQSDGREGYSPADIRVGRSVIPGTHGLPVTKPVNVKNERPQTTLTPLLFNALAICQVLSQFHVLTH